MTIYKNGKKLSSKQVKQETQRIRGWSDKEYAKQLNLIKRGIKRKQTNEKPSELLYRESKAISRYGSTYQQTDYIKLIRELGAYKSTPRKFKGKRQATRTVQGIITQKQSTYVVSRFNGLIRDNAQARAIYEELKNKPFKLEQALSDYANKLHKKIDERERVVAGEAIPFSSQTYGSDSIIDFDLTVYE